MKLARVSLLLPLIALSATAQKVTVEFDQAGTFSDYKTFALRNGVIHSKNPSLNNGIVDKKIQTELRARLIAKGLTEVSSEPDLNVRYTLGSGQRTEVDRYPAGWRGLGTRVVRTHYTEGTLVIDMNDAKRRELVWRAIAVEDKNDPMKIQESLPDMVRKAIDKYPPKPK